MSYLTPMDQRARDHRAENRERHLTLLDFGTPRDERRRKEILQLIEGYERDIEVNQLAVRNLRRDLARLEKRR